MQMKKFFQAIRQGDLATVRELLEKKPELISDTAKQPPKKDDGQSPLQVALKAGKFDIAEYLLDMGADVNFMEADTCANEWRAPVLHDAINAAVMNCRWNTNSPHGGIEVFSTKENADRAYGILKRMIEMGADVNGKDSYGNSCLWRFCLQARQILPAYNHVEHKLGNDRVVTKELTDDLSGIFLLLKEHGMDMDYIKPNASCKAEELYKEEPIAYFLNLETRRKRKWFTKIIRT